MQNLTARMQAVKRKRPQDKQTFRLQPICEMSLQPLAEMNVLLLLESPDSAMIAPINEDLL